jgi:CHRD domain
MHSHHWLVPRLSIAFFLVAAAGSVMQSRVSAADSDNAALTSNQPSEMLSGSLEVPAVDSSASAECSIAVATDGSVTGKLTTSDIDGTAAHIHAGAVGTNGPVLITLTKTSATQWSVPAGSQLTPAQYDSYQQGGLYVNVHSAAHPDGEIRMQLK